MIGIKNTRSPQDERLVECIFTSHLSPDSAFSSTAGPSTTPPLHIYGATPTNLIIDARPTANAMANRAKGAGTENMDWYKGCKKEHLGIDNIHVMRNSLKSVAETLAEAEASQMPVDRERLRRSGWLKHIAAIMEGSVTIIKNIHVYSSHVLIHCSDGWDRTSQLSAIAQLCLDPYFRTIEGFKVLVEKDWLAFGHMFMQRSGHLSSDKLFTATPENFDQDEESDDDFGGAIKGAQAFFSSVTKTFTSSSHLKEISPVFHQFLDCVRQIQRQFPERFEFNEDYLLDLHYHLYACQFGTFLFDSERARRVPLGGKGKAYIDRTVSAWDWFDLPAQRQQYLNADYNPKLDDRESREHDADMGVLIPDAKNIKFWHRLFKRSEEDMNAPMSRFLAPETPSETPEEVDSSAEVSRQPSPRPPAPIRQDSAASSVAASVAGLPSPAAASPFARLPTTVNKNSSAAAQAGAGWNWSQLSNGLSTGALTAFNQIKTSASEAVKQLRESADDEMWGATPGSTAPGGSYAPGTGIGEASRGNLPRTALRMPSESNPWTVESPSAILAAEVASPSVATPSARNPPPSPKRETSASTTSSSWTHANPWGDAPVSRSLADLSLDDVAGRKAAASPATEVKPAPAPAPAPAPSPAPAPAVKVAPVATTPLDPTPVPVKEPEPAAPAPTKQATDDELLAAALGGDSKAWDPLGAL